MRTISFILAFAFVMAGSSMAGSAETGLPGIGTFSYNGSPVVTSHRLWSLPRAEGATKAIRESCP